MLNAQTHMSHNQAGFPAGALRSGDINWKNADGWHIMTALDIELSAGCDVDRLPLRPDAALSVCGEDFQTHYVHPTWGWVEELLGVRPTKSQAMEGELVPEDDLA
ncbi:hypothetical protein PIB30_085464 [Stylosanthes scabra]|uniref:Uncharacterized protein n=1 Tax=Stylosanthes scabra TaxID=79078 RepID=A0ABU6XUN6_9FABA|nr:hypothetical protein [Stylosanthes scabra]